MKKHECYSLSKRNENLLAANIQLNKEVEELKSKLEKAQK